MKEKLNINQELEHIIEKYHLDRHYPAYRLSKRACGYISGWIGRLSGTGNTYLFIGMDEHALKMINSWSKGKNIGILLIEAVQELDGLIGKLEKADGIYVVSYSNTVEILHWFWRHGLDAESIYDVLENAGIYLQMEFYRFFPPIKMDKELELHQNAEEKSKDGSSLILYEFYYQKQRLRHGAYGTDRERITEKLFFLALCMKNFLEAERIRNTMPNIPEWEKCWEEIEGLFDTIRKALLVKPKDNIIIYWLDALPYEEAEKMEYLQQRRTHSLYLHNAFTVTPYTNPTCKSMFCAVRQIDDLGYQLKRIDLENSPLLQEMEAQGYLFHVISAYLSPLFPAEYSHCVGSTKRDSCSEVFWNLLHQVLQGECKTVFLVHALVELHTPCLSVRREEFEKGFDEKYRSACRSELDSQLHFYDELLGDGFYRIYMSDRGVGSDIRHKVRIHFQVYHAAWKGQETDKVFSLLDFQKIMHDLFRRQEVDVSLWNREYAPVQDVDYYNKNGLEIFLGQRRCDLPFLTAYKGIAMKEGIYLRFKTGDELFDQWTDMRLPVFYTDHLPKDSEMFKNMREKAGGFPKEMDSDPKFRYAAYTYKVYENVKRTVRTAAEFINEKLGAYADGSIALRMGGNHSWQLYGVLTENSKRKIGAVIDGNDGCMCRDLGIPVVGVEGILRVDGIRAILLSSFIYLDELRAEARDIYREMEIIDIYDDWKQAGYPFQNDFWYGLETDREVGFPHDS